MDDAVRLEYVSGGDGGHTSLGVSQDDVVAGERSGEVFTLNGLEGGLAAALPDHGDELFGADLAGHDVVGEDLGEGVLVLGLHEGVDGTGRQLAERLIRWREYGEGAGAVEGVNQACSLYCRYEGFVDGRVDRVLYDGFGGEHVCAANLGVAHLGRGDDGGDGENSSRHHCEECRLHGRYPFVFLV